MFKYKLAILIVGFGLMVRIANAQAISSTDLINNAKEYDGKIITYEGEVIGDIMTRGQHAWININDGQNAIGIWVDNLMVKDIVYVGSYKAKGDEVEIKGVFHRACIEHGGDLDIHVQSIRKISTGRQISEALDFNKIKIVLMLSGILILFLMLDLLVHKKYRKGRLPKG